LATNFPVAAAAGHYFNSSAKLSKMPLSPSAVATSLSQIESSSASSRQDAYQKLLSQIVSDSGDDISLNLQKYVQSLLGGALGVLATRPLLTCFVSEFKKIANPEVKVEAGRAILSALEPHAASFEEQDVQLKDSVADALEEQEDFIGAAKVLQSINLEGAGRAASANGRAKHLVRIVRCYLEEDQPENAVLYLDRIKNFLPDVTDASTRLLYTLCQARILDSQGKFLDASAAYYRMSLDALLAEEEALRGLSNAITCAILGPAGPLRARALGQLYKDERSTHVQEHAILEKIYLNRLLAPDEVKAFAKKLSPHQVATTSDGSTVLEKAVLEHNLLAVSRLYENVPTRQLGQLLGVDADRAESYAAQMIEQGRLSGYIDQIEGLIFFEGEETGEKKVGHSDAIVGREQRKWDNSVQGIAEEVEHVTTLIQKMHPVHSLPASTEMLSNMAL
jgi:COP9 signalosome complex subunit 4